MGTRIVPEPTPRSPRPQRLLRSVATISSLTMGSRVLGLVRDILLAAVLGATPLSDAFQVAFKLPNFLRRLFAEGAFNAGFVPLFSRVLQEEGQQSAKEFARQAQAVLVAVLVPLVVTGVLAMPWVIRVIAPGFEVGGERFEATVELSRITLVYILFISLVALYGGMLNSLGKFAAAAAAPILLNICLISGLLFARGTGARPAWVLAWCVALSGAVQLVALLIAARREHFVLAPRLAVLSAKVRRLFALILPGLVGAGVAQISLFADIFFSSLLPPGAVSYLYYADRLSQLPLGVIGVAVGTALLPLMSRQLRAGNDVEAVASQNRAIEVSLLLTIPAAVGLACAGEQIVSVLFERGAFGETERLATTRAVRAYCLGLPGYVLVKALAPGYFSREDTSTPVKIAVVCLVVNAGTAWALIGPLQHVGIALATVASSWLNALLLGAGLRRRGLFAIDEQLRRNLPRMAAASALMAVALLSVQALAGGLPGWLSLVATLAVAIGVYGVSVQKMGIVDLWQLGARVRGRAPRR